MEYEDDSLTILWVFDGVMTAGKSTLWVCVHCTIVVFHVSCTVQNPDG